MDFAQRNKFPGDIRYTPELHFTGTKLQTFNGDKAIQEHLDHVAKLKDYMCARTKEIPEVPLNCHGACQVSQWLSSESGKEFVNRKMLDSVCKRCERFMEIAAQSVLLTKMDRPEPVRDVLQSTLDFESASKSFQSGLAELLVECGYNQ
ncbi:MAG: hypothetical protein KJ795_07405 [Gammaproteobacteria bacterium]|nr:hypothetical protein [Gammaproteobacteria bacterium]MBU1776778.1 hypothetical protein [Gammaproteobacteria bacterium]MBU1969812.1 hypothetical protein [Gammaproteobacteria bacterium]